MDMRAESDWESEVEGHRAAFLDSLLLIAVIGGLVAVVLTYVTLPNEIPILERWVEVVPFFTGWLVVLVVWMWRGLGYRTRSLIVLLLAYVLSVFIFRRGGLPGSGRVWLLMLPALAFILLGVRPGIVAGVAGALTYAVFAFAFSQKWLVPLVSEDQAALATWLSEGGSFLLIMASLILVLWSYGRSWLEALAKMGATSRQLQDQARELERANEQLRRQTTNLQTTTDIARAGSSVLDPEALFAKVVSRIQTGFESLGVYYVGLFLLDQSSADAGEQFAILKAATGEAGNLLLEMGHKLPLDDATSVGWCITHQQARIVLDVEEGTVRFDAVFMPHTRSEIALPLRSRGRVLGALNVHSTHEASFNETDISALQTMADQIAVAIDNARLFSQTEAALEQAQAAHQRYLVEAWDKFMTVIPEARVDYVQSEAKPGDEELLREARSAALLYGISVARDGAVSESGDGPSQTALVIPLKLREQVIGTVTLNETRHPRPWQAGEIAMAETVAEQIALSVENLRLMDETQRSAVRERLVGEISDKMQRATDMEALMRVTVEELNRVLDGSRAYVRMSTTAELAGGGDDRSGDRLTRSDDEERFA